MNALAVLLLVQGSPLHFAKAAYEQGRLFDLARIVNKVGGQQGVGAFLQGYVLAGRNRSESAIPMLRKAVSTTHGIWRRRSLETLGTTYARMGSYRAASASFESVLRAKDFPLTEKERISTENSKKVFESLRHVPPMTARIPSDVRLQVPKSPGFKLPFECGGAKLTLTADTGADFSLVRESLARKMKLRQIKNEVDLGSITGDKTRAWFAVADRLRFGSAEVRNVVFLVMRDENLFIPQLKFQLDGVIGLPVLLKLKDVTFHKDGRVDIRKSTVSTEASNLLLSGFKPFVVGKYQGKEFTFAFDSGANTTMIYLPFFRAFRAEIEARGFPTKSRMAGVAGVRESAAYTLIDLSLEFADRSAAFSKVDVITEVRDDAGRKFFGNVGQDLMLQFESARFNWRSMRLSLNGKRGSAE